VDAGHCQVNKNGLPTKIRVAELAKNVVEFTKIAIRGFSPIVSF
jgi:hypothetical protein